MIRLFTEWAVAACRLGSSSRTQHKSKPTILLKVPLENKDVGFKKNEPNLRKL